MLQTASRVKLLSCSLVPFAPSQSAFRLCVRVLEQDVEVNPRHTGETGAALSPRRQRPGGSYTRLRTHSSTLTPRAAAILPPSRPDAAAASLSPLLRVWQDALTLGP